MIYRSLFWLLLGLAVVAAPATALAAKLKPPLQMLRQGPSVTMVAEIVAIAAEPPSLTARTKSTLRGKSRDEIVVLIDRNLLPRLSTGLTVVLVYSDVDAVRGKPGVFQQRREGRLLSTDGAEPALFIATPETEALFAPAHRDVEKTAAFRRTVLDGIQHSDRHLANLYAGELAIRRSWWPALEPSDQSRILAVIGDPSAHPAARARLLQAVAATPLFGDDRLAPLLTTILSTESIDNDGSALRNRELPIFAAFDAALSRKLALPALAIERWVGGTSPALAEQALLALRAQDATIERAALHRALDTNLLPAVTREFLNDHLRRLDIAALVSQSTSP